MAPELLQGQPYNKSADIYSFGIIMRKAINTFPDFHFNNYEIFPNLIAECLDINPNNRPSFENIYDRFRSFVENINIDEFDVYRIQDYIQQLDVNETHYSLESKNGKMTYIYIMVLVV